MSEASLVTARPQDRNQSISDDMAAIESPVLSKCRTLGSLLFCQCRIFLLFCVLIVLRPVA